MVLNPLGKEHGVRTRFESPEEDSAVSVVLHFLAVDIHCRPDRLQAVDSHLLTRINTLVDHMEVDLNLPLLDDDE